MTILQVWDLKNGTNNDPSWAGFFFFFGKREMKRDEILMFFPTSRLREYKRNAMIVREK